jgi:hypothetical protein
VSKFGITRLKYTLTYAMQEKAAERAAGGVGGASERKINIYGKVFRALAFVAVIGGAFCFVISFLEVIGVKFMPEWLVGRTDTPQTGGGFGFGGWGRGGISLGYPIAGALELFAGIVGLRADLITRKVDGAIILCVVTLLDWVSIAAGMLSSRNAHANYFALVVNLLVTVVYFAVAVRFKLLGQPKESD